MGMQSCQLSDILVHTHTHTCLSMCAVCAMLGDVVFSVWARVVRCKGNVGRGLGDANPQNGNLPIFNDNYIVYLHEIFEPLLTPHTSVLLDISRLWPLSGTDCDSN